MRSVHHPAHHAPGRGVEAYWNGFGYRVYFRTAIDPNVLYRFASPDGLDWYMLLENGRTTRYDRVGVHVHFTGGPLNGKSADV